MKKADIIKNITILLKEKGGELRTENLEKKLRNWRGFRCYAIRYEWDGVYAIPWANSNACWSVRWEKLLKADLLDLLKKAEEMP